MKCFYRQCKGRIHTSYPPNELCTNAHHFCYYHYQCLIKCTKLEIQLFYKNCAMEVNTKSSNLDESK